MDYKSFTGFKDSPVEDREEMKDVRGVYRTESLFVEVIQPSSRGKYKPLYSLKEAGNKGLPSIYQIWMTSIDEADAAMRILGSLQHWKKLCSLKWFITGRPEHGFSGLNSWREDMASRDRTLAKQSLLKQCEEGNVSAARALDKMATDAIKTSGIIRGKGSDGKKKEDSAILSLLDRHK